MEPTALFDSDDRELDYRGMGPERVRACSADAGDLIGSYAKCDSSRNIFCLWYWTTSHSRLATIWRVTGPGNVRHRLEFRQGCQAGHDTNPNNSSHVQLPVIGCS